MEEKDAVNTKNPVNTDKNNRDGFALIPYTIAIGVLIAYGFFIYFLTGKADAKELDWSRLIYLFSGVEAIVFAAAGFLFGREVNRKRAENAEEEKKRANKQKEEAKELAVEERKKGLILGAMAIQEQRTASNVTAQETAMEIATSQNSKASIAQKAQSMYPELRD